MSPFRLIGAKFVDDALHCCLCVCSEPHQHLEGIARANKLSIPVSINPNLIDGCFANIVFRGLRAVFEVTAVK